MSPVFEDSWPKLERAKIHIAEFEREVAVYDDVSIYRCLAQTDTDTGFKVHKIRMMKALRPKNLSPIVGDAVNNLREVLDTACFAIATATTFTNHPRHCAFPFGGSVRNFETNGRGRCTTLSDEWFALFKAFQPYKGGNNLLWGLNELCITNKHKTLTTFRVHARRAESATIRYMEESSFFVTFPVVRWDSANQEIIVAISNECPDLKIQCEYSFFIAFDEIEPVAHQEVLGILRQLSSIVESILMAIEGEARRIRLFGLGL